LDLAVQLCGPHGNSLKQVEAATGCRVLCMVRVQSKILPRSVLQPWLCYRFHLVTGNAFWQTHPCGGKLRFRFPCSVGRKDERQAWFWALEWVVTSCISGGWTACKHNSCSWDSPGASESCVIVEPNIFL
jgi:hypothetical protein